MLVEPSSIVLQVIILVFLLGMSAFFSSSETALTAFSKIKMRRMADEGDKQAKLVNTLAEKPGKMLSALLIGNNIVNISATAIATSLAMSIGGEKGVAVSTIIMTVLVIIFGEITPKTIASRSSEQVALKVASPITIIAKILTPAVVVANFLAGGVIKFLVGDIITNEPSITEEDLRSIVDVGQEEGVFEQDEKEMIYNVFDFADLHVKDIMTQRMDIQAVDVNITYENLIEAFRCEQFSRMPVYEEGMDKVVGTINIKNIFLEKDVEKDFDIRKYMKAAHFTFEYKMADDLFKEMNKNRTHMVIVVDEYGGTSGLITIEDLIEEVLGDIEDEYDDYEQEIEAISETEYLINASTKIEEVNQALGINLYSEEYDSIGGFMIGELGHIPEVDETVEYEGVIVKAEVIDKNRVKEVRVFMNDFVK